MTPEGGSAMKKPACLGAWILIGVLGWGSAAAAGNRSRDGGAAGWVEGGDVHLAAALSDARSMALARIEQHPECRELFGGRGADGARLLDRTAYRSAALGEAGGLCERGAAAFTGMRTGRTALCSDNFLKLDRHYRAVVLLHEALHVAGLGQAPF